MFLFKLLSFCLGSATLGGTGAAIYYAINFTKDVGSKASEIKLEQVGQQESQLPLESQSQQETPSAPASQSEPQPPEEPIQTGLLEVGQEESSISRTK